MEKEILWKKEIDNIRATGFLNVKTNICDALIEYFYNEILSMEEKILINLLLSKNPQQDELNKLLKNWDIETKNGAKSLILSYILKINPHLRATNYEEPRLKGLFLNQRFANLQTISHFKKIGIKLNKNNITPFLFNNSLMKFLNPNFPRYINDTDILVDKSCWVKSAKITKSLGYKFKKITKSTFVVYDANNSKNRIMDIHKNILEEIYNNKKLIKNFYKRAQKKTIYKTNVYIPAFEDMLFITLMHISNDLRKNKAPANLLYKISDCKFLIDNKEDFCWKILGENAKLTKSEVKINFAIKFINKISDNIFPEEIRNNTLFEKETNDYSRMIIFKNFYYKDLQQKCREMKILNIIKKPKMLKEYLYLKIKYKSLKALNSHPKLIKLLIKDLNKTEGCINAN